MGKTELRLKAAAEAIGVSTVTLKRWLLDGKVPEVRRDRNGWRVFEEQDIRRICAYRDRARETAPVYGEGGAQPTQYTVASLFSGIGGFEIGFEREGYRVAFQCEIDGFCRSILDKHWPTTERATDIRSISSATAIPTSDVWVGGFPCQDVSLARMGPRKGLRGRQSRLFYEFARLVGEGRPRVLVVENVHGLLNSHKGRDFAAVVSTLAELGYAVGWRTFNSKDFGVPQSRRRVYIVGCYRDWRGPGAILFEPECSKGDAAAGRSNGTKPISPFKRVLGDTCGTGPVYQGLAYCLYACSARHTGTDWSRTYVSYPKLGRVRRLTPSECEGVMGFPVDWTVPDESELASEDIETKRYHALGNAVTPPVAQWIAGRVRRYLQTAASPGNEALGSPPSRGELKVV